MISYTINFTSNSKTPFVIAPGEYDGPNHLLESPPRPAKAHTSLNIPGAGSIRYGEMVNEDLVHLLENFYSSTAPQVPTFGQTWVSTDDHPYTYTSNSQWTRSPLVNPEATQAMDGDIRVVGGQVYIYANGTYVAIGGGGGGISNPYVVTSQVDWGFTSGTPSLVENWGLTSDIPTGGMQDWGGVFVESATDYGYTDAVADSIVDWGTETDNTIDPSSSVSWGHATPEPLGVDMYGN